MFPDRPHRPARQAITVVLDGVALVHGVLLAVFTSPHSAVPARPTWWSGARPVAGSAPRRSGAA